jgi:hypothetical protein
MDPKEEGGFLSTVSEYLVSLPFDLKILQEAASDSDLDRPARDIAAGAVVHTLLPQEGDGPLRFADDVLLVRLALAAIQAKGGEAFGAFGERFREVYERLDADMQLFDRSLGPLWKWLGAKIETFPKLIYKGKKAAQYVDSEEGLAQLYDEGLEFETNYNVSEEQVRNKLRRAEQVTDMLTKRRTEEMKKIS